MSMPPSSFPPPGPGPVPGPAGRSMPGVADAMNTTGKGGKKAKDAKPRSPRRFGVIALVLAILTFGGLLLVFTASRPAKTYVVRAQTALNPTFEVTGSGISAVAVNPETAEPGAISGSSAEQALARANGTEKGPNGEDWGVVGRRPLYPIGQGQTLRSDMFSSTAGQLETPLAPTERLVSVKAQAASAVAGSLQVGDRVDIVAADSNIAGLVVENVEIIAIQADADALASAQSRQATPDGRNLTPQDVLPTEPIPGTYVIRVASDRAVALAAADASGDLYLVYRTNDATGIANGAGAFTLRSAICSLPSSSASQACR